MFIIRFHHLPTVSYLNSLKQTEVKENTSLTSSLSEVEVKLETPDKFESNPSKDLVLRAEERIKQMISLFENGGHIETNDKHDTCRENDIEALQRQLRKIRRWQESVETFEVEDIEDLDFIVSAIEKHVRYISNCNAFICNGICSVLVITAIWPD